MIQVFTDLFNTCLHNNQVLKAWKNALTVLIHKKEVHQASKTTDQSPYLYKVFSNILLQRTIRALDFHYHVSKPDLEQVMHK